VPLLSSNIDSNLIFSGKIGGVAGLLTGGGFQALFAA